jgi:hypothetical protein
MLDVLRFIKFDPKWKQFIANVVIVISQAILVSLDFYIPAVAVIAVCLFAVVNRKELIKFLNMTKTILKGLKKGN